MASSDNIADAASELLDVTVRVRTLRASIDGLLPRAQELHEKVVHEGEALDAAVKESVSAAQQAMGALTAELASLGTVRSEAVSLLSDASTKLYAAQGTAQESLEELEESLDAAVPRLEELVDRASSWFTQMATRAESEAKDPLQKAEKAWAEELDELEDSTHAAFETHRTQIKTLLTEFRDTGGRVGRAMHTDADTLRRQMADQFQRLTAGVQDNIRSSVSNLTDTYSRVRNDAATLNRQIADIRNGLADLTATVSETAEAATEAMDATNIGLSTAAEIFDNLRGTLHDIEEAWQS